jgi:hypothetical protein
MVLGGAPAKEGRGRASAADGQMGADSSRPSSRAPDAMDWSFPSSAQDTASRSAAPSSSSPSQDKDKQQQHFPGPPLPPLSTSSSSLSSLNNLTYGWMDGLVAGLDGAGEQGPLLSYALVIINAKNYPASPSTKGILFIPIPITPGSAICCCIPNFLMGQQ